jgi:hypothetical protein
VASKIHFILAALASNSCKASRNLKNARHDNWFTALKYQLPTSIGNETIFHLIMKSTLAKLCGVGIVYLIFLLTEMKCQM